MYIVSKIGEPESRDINGRSAVEIIKDSAEMLFCEIVLNNSAIQRSGNVVAGMLIIDESFFSSGQEILLEEREEVFDTVISYLSKECRSILFVLPLEANKITTARRAPTSDSNSIEIIPMINGNIEIVAMVNGNIIPSIAAIEESRRENACAAQNYDKPTINEVLILNGEILKPNENMPSVYCIPQGEVRKVEDELNPQRYDWQIVSCKSTKAALHAARVSAERAQDNSYTKGSGGIGK